MLSFAYALALPGLRTIAAKTLLFLTLFPGVTLGAALVLWSSGRWFLRPKDQRRSEYLLVISIITLLLDGVAQSVTNRLSILRPLKYDLYVYRIDALYGQPSFALGRFVEPRLWLMLILHISYALLPVAVTAVLAGYIWEREIELRLVLVALALNLFLAPLFYLAFPVCGPGLAFPTFPAAQPHMTLHLIALNAPPNGVPSVHMSTALLIVWFSRHWRPGLFFAVIYLLLTIGSTLASGQHYLFDLVAAVPYTFAIVWLARRAQLRPSEIESEREAMQSF